MIIEPTRESTEKPLSTRFLILVDGETNETYLLDNGYITMSLLLNNDILLSGNIYENGKFIHEGVYYLSEEIENNQRGLDYFYKNKEHAQEVYINVRNWKSAKIIEIKGEVEYE